MTIILRLITISLAGLFAARGGGWWVLAGMYVLVTITPLKPSGTRFAFLASLCFAAVVAAMFAGLALKEGPSALLGVLTLYFLAQAVYEWLASQGKLAGKVA